MRVALLSVALVACKSTQPPTVNEPPRLDAVEACTQQAPAVLPVPPRPPGDPYRISPWALMGFRDREGFHAATFLCDLPSRVLVLAAEQGIENGKRKTGGTAWSLPRPGSVGAAVPVPILASSKGCIEGEVTCTWATGSVDEPSIDQLKGPQWVATSGWVHGVEDMCRALPDDTIAVCSTASRLAYVELGCSEPGGPVKLQLGLHDETLERAYDLDVENPVARLYGQADPPRGDTWSYRFTGAGDAKGKLKAATLSIDVAGKSAHLELDGAREACIAFGLYRR